MKMTINGRAKKKGGREAAHVGSVDRSRSSTVFRGATDNFPVRDPDRARYADPTRN